MRFFIHFVPAVLVLVAVNVAAAEPSQRVFFSDFDNGAPAELSGFKTKIRGVERLAGVGSAASKFAGNLLQNDSGYETGDRPPKPTTFTLTNLPQHTSVDLNFLLAILNTWDEDLFEVKVDGKSVFSDRFALGRPLARLYMPPAGGLLTPVLNTSQGGRPDYADYGFDNSYGDQAYNMSLEPRLHDIPHTADSLTIDLLVPQNGWQGGTNESFGIDNFEVRLGGVVPEPSGLALLCVGGLSLISRHRRA